MKLEDIPKKDIFNVPEGYFDKLPNTIQARITSQKSASSWGSPWVTALKYAVPAVVLVVAGILWFNKPVQDAETILASIQTEDLVAYLDDSDLTTDDVLESVDFNADDVDQIENEVYELNINTVDYNEMLDELD